MYTINRHKEYSRQRVQSIPLSEQSILLSRQYNPTRKQYNPTRKQCNPKNPTDHGARSAQRTTTDIDDTTVDSNISAFNNVVCFIEFVFNNMLKPKK